MPSLAYTEMDQTKYRVSSMFAFGYIIWTLLLSDFINLTQVHNFTVSAQDILPSVDFRYLPYVLQEFCNYFCR